MSTRSIYRFGAVLGLLSGYIWIFWIHDFFLFNPLLDFVPEPIHEILELFVLPTLVGACIALLFSFFKFRHEELKDKKTIHIFCFFMAGHLSFWMLFLFLYLGGYVDQQL